MYINIQSIDLSTSQTPFESFYSKGRNVNEATDLRQRSDQT